MAKSKAAATKTLQQERQEQERRALDLQRMREPRAWPRWPWLPMKKYDDSGLTCAVFHADDTDPKVQPKIYFVSLFEIKTYFPTPDMRSQQYESMAAILEDVWMVD